MRQKHWIRLRNLLSLLPNNNSEGVHNSVSLDNNDREQVVFLPAPEWTALEALLLSIEELL